jgi:hypothetical protein
MKIAELFENYETETLEEHLGNLAVVDKKFLKLLKTAVEYKYNGNNAQMQSKYVQRMPVYLGSKSKVDSYETKSGAEAYRQLVEDDTAKAIVINHDTEQVFVAFKIPADNSRENFAYLWTADIVHLLGHSEHNEQFEEAKAKLEKAKIKAYDSPTDGIVRGNAKELYAALTTIFKLSKELGHKTVDLHVIHVDEERAATKIQRAARKKTPNWFEQIPAEIPVRLKKDKEFWSKYAKDALQSRLIDFKTNNAKEANTPEEMFKLIQSHGFLDRIKVNGFVYKVDSSNLQFDRLIKAARGTAEEKSRYKDDNYIEYGMDYLNSENDIKQAKIKKQLEIMTKGDKDRMKQLASQYLPPYKIKVYLKLDKASIVVDHVDADKWIRKLNIK